MFLLMATGFTTGDSLVAFSAVLAVEGLFDSVISMTDFSSSRESTSSMAIVDATGMGSGRGSPISSMWILRRSGFVFFA